MKRRISFSNPTAGSNRWRCVAAVLMVLTYVASMPVRNTHAAETVQTTQAAASPAAPAYLPAMDHVGIIVKDANKAASQLVERLGGTIMYQGDLHFRSVEYKGQTMAFSVYLVFVNLGNAKVEFIQPNPNVPSPYLDILNEKGEYAHHICFLVPSATAFTEKLKASYPGIKVVVKAQADTETGGGDMVYVEGLIPGTLVELATPI